MSDAHDPDSDETSEIEELRGDVQGIYERGMFSSLPIQYLGKNPSLCFTFTPIRPWEEQSNASDELAFESLPTLYQFCVLQIVKDFENISKQARDDLDHLWWSLPVYLRASVYNQITYNGRMQHDNLCLFKDLPLLKQVSVMEAEEPHQLVDLLCLPALSELTAASLDCPNLPIEVVRLLPDSVNHLRLDTQHSQPRKSAPRIRQSRTERLLSQYKMTPLRFPANLMSIILLNFPTKCTLVWVLSQLTELEHLTELEIYSTDEVGYSLRAPHTISISRMKKLKRLSVPTYLMSAASWRHITSLPHIECIIGSRGPNFELQLTDRSPIIIYNSMTLETFCAYLDYAMDTDSPSDILYSSAAAEALIGQGTLMDPLSDRRRALNKTPKGDVTYGHIMIRYCVEMLRRRSTLLCLYRASWWLWNAIDHPNPQWMHYVQTGVLVACQLPCSWAIEEVIRAGGLKVLLELLRRYMLPQQEELGRKLAGIISNLTYHRPIVQIASCRKPFSVEQNASYIWHPPPEKNVNLVELAEQNWYLYRGTEIWRRGGILLQISPTCQKQLWNRKFLEKLWTSSHQPFNSRLPSPMESNDAKCLNYLILSNLLCSRNHTGVPDDCKDIVHDVMSHALIELMGWNGGDPGQLPHYFSMTNYLCHPGSRVKREHTLLLEQLLTTDIQSLSTTIPKTPLLTLLSNLFHRSWTPNSSSAKGVKRWIQVHTENPDVVLASDAGDMDSLHFSLPSLELEARQVLCYILSFLYHASIDPTSRFKLTKKEADLIMNFLGVTPRPHDRCTIIWSQPDIIISWITPSATPEVLSWTLKMLCFLAEDNDYREDITDKNVTEKLLSDVIERADFGKYQSQIFNCCKELRHRLFGQEKSESSQDAEGEGSRKKMKL
ncbi:hypothetical protein PROFUN_09920 [Planoprotostelium fungivorum]|uniref:Uncharacterized protein n=1 Tax=Planoprotostelium fungivorum TaxID=1890364 RepID=A0A2P6NG98_9EUKA|nr:hypothetical protein PROFUN_09920 [Planoprotostelium fungivorum]